MAGLLACAVVGTTANAQPSGCWLQRAKTADKWRESMSKTPARLTLDPACGSADSHFELEPVHDLPPHPEADADAAPPAAFDCERGRCGRFRRRSTQRHAQGWAGVLARRTGPRPVFKPELQDLDHQGSPRPGAGVWSKQRLLVALHALVILRVALASISHLGYVGSWWGNVPVVVVVVSVVSVGLWWRCCTRCRVCSSFRAQVRFLGRLPPSPCCSRRGGVPRLLWTTHPATARRLGAGKSNAGRCSWTRLRLRSVGGGRIGHFATGGCALTAPARLCWRGPTLDALFGAESDGRTGEWRLRSAPARFGPGCETPPHAEAWSRPLARTWHQTM